MKEKSGKIPFRERIRESLDMPPDMLGGVSCVELKGGCQLTVHGCEKILEYGEEIIKLRLIDGVLEIYGCRLYCTTYVAKAIEVSGCINRLDFSRE